MNKIAKIAGAVCAGAGLIVGEIAVHGYLDIMYRETIKPSVIKRIANKNGTAGMDDFAIFNKNCCEWVNKQSIEEVLRTSSRGYDLKGYLLLNPVKNDTFVLFAHGYRADHNGDPANFERFYYEKGYNFMSVDHTCSGNSGGNWVGFDYFEAADMLEWVDYIVSRFGENVKIILHGVSMGGSTVCQMASRVPNQVKAIISDCAYTSAVDQFASVANRVGITKTTPYILHAFNLLNKRLAGYDLALTDVRNSVKNSKVPMLFVHGKIDDFVPVEMCYELYDLCTAEKDILIVDNAYHAQSIMVEAETYEAKILEFISKYL